VAVSFGDRRLSHHRPELLMASARVPAGPRFWRPASCVQRKPIVLWLPLDNSSQPPGCGIDSDCRGAADAGEIGGQILGSTGLGPEKCMLRISRGVGKADDRARIVNSARRAQRPTQGRQPLHPPADCQTKP